MNKIKKAVFIAGLCMSLLLGLSLSNSQSQGREEDFGGKAKCHHNATTVDGTTTDFCSNSVCVERNGMTGNNFYRCG